MMSDRILIEFSRLRRAIAPFNIRTLGWLAALAIVGIAPRLSANPTEFALDMSRSSLKITSTAATAFGPAQFGPQVGGSDTTSYSGTILANLSAGEIEFPGMSSVSANNFVGVPLTPDNPANYGMTATVSGAMVNATVHNLVFDLTSSALVVAPDGTFPANTSAATITSGSIYYLAPDPIGTGVITLVGSSGVNQATTASIAVAGNTQTITIPINVTVPFSASDPNDSTATFTGQLVATRTLVTPTSAFWQGNLDSNWSTIQPTAATNWKTDATGATETFALPGAGSDVFFTTSDHGANLATTLGANFSIKGLTFTSDAINPVTIGGSNGLTLGADGLSAQSGASAATINCPVVLAASQTWSNGSANPLTINGNVSLGSSTLTESGSGVIVLAGSQSFGDNSAVMVTSGSLRFNSAALATAIGAGVVVSVDNGAQLELANSGSALSDGTHFAKIANDSQLAAGGLLVSGTNQRVGLITGTGDTVVASGASLMANGIRQNTLEIGGAAASHSLVTIAASDAAGNPLDGSPLLSSMSGGSVPEPSGLVFAIIAAALLGGLRCAAGPYRRGSPNHRS
jgi:hypothetical protein